MVIAHINPVREISDIAHRIAPALTSYSPGIDAETLGVIGLTSALVSSVMASQHAGSEKTAAAETKRFGAELGGLFLEGMRKPELLPTTAGPDRILDPPDGSNHQ